MVSPFPPPDVMVGVVMVSSSVDVDDGDGAGDGIGDVIDVLMDEGLTGAGEKGAMDVDEGVDVVVDVGGSLIQSRSFCVEAST